MTKRLLIGASVLIKSLIHKGVDVVFGYPGGQAIPIYDSLYDYKKKLRHILVRHEQGAVHAAQGYARASGKTGVVIVTSGPGISNTVTGIADAMIDSTPIVIIAGQVSSTLLGTDAFQEIDVIGITQAISKWAYQIRSADEIPWAIARAFYIALSGRPGPVILDITKNAQIAITHQAPIHINHIRSYSPIPTLDKKSIKSAASLINNSKKPFALVGQGVILSNAEKELSIFLKKTDIPVAFTMLGLSALATNDPLNMGMLGMHGNIAANLKTNECDVLIAIGMRFDDRVTGDLKTYAKQATIIHFDIDPSEINKNVQVKVSVLGDIKEALIAITHLLKKTQHVKWKETFKDPIEKEYKIIIQNELYPLKGSLRMGEVIRKVSEATKNNAILVTDVGQAQMMSVRYFKYKQTRSLITSGGLGTMGFGLPASIGARLGSPHRIVCLFVGDGGFQMTIQELGTIMQYNLNIKIILLNNNYLGMVRQWQELFFNKRYSETAIKNPDFIHLAKAYGIPGKVVFKRTKLKSAIDEMLQTKGAYLLEVKVLKKSMVYPMIPTGSCITNVLLGNEK